MEDKEIQTGFYTFMELVQEDNGLVDKETQIYAFIEDRMSAEVSVQTDLRYLPSFARSRDQHRVDITVPTSYELTDVGIQTDACQSLKSTPTKHSDGDNELQRAFVSNIENEQISPTSVIAPLKPQRIFSLQEANENSTPTTMISHNSLTENIPGTPEYFLAIPGEDEVKLNSRGQSSKSFQFLEEVVPNAFNDFALNFDELTKEEFVYNPTDERITSSYKNRKINNSALRMDKELREEDKSEVTENEEEDEIEEDKGDEEEELNELYPFPLNYMKEELVQNCNFSELDHRAMSLPLKIAKNEDLSAASSYLGLLDNQNELCKARLIFRWTINYIRLKLLSHDFSLEHSSENQLNATKIQVHSLKMFKNLCSQANLKCKIIYGYTKNHNCVLGRKFLESDDPNHIWTAICIDGIWRFADPILASGTFTATSKSLDSKIDEFFFLTDPQALIYIHFPCKMTGKDYKRWQLLDTPISLEDFNSFPVIYSTFFRYKLRLRRTKKCPANFSRQTEIQLASSLVLQYRVNFTLTDVIKTPFTEWVFCQLKEGGVVGSFTIRPPFPGLYQLEISALLDSVKSSPEMKFPVIAVFPMECTKARKNPISWPLHEGIWGPNSQLYRCGLEPMNQDSPIIWTWGGRKLLIFEKIFEVLLLFQIFDKNGQLLESKGILKKEETEDQIRLTIVPPYNGHFKLMMYGMMKPKIKGRWKIPLLATYLIECRMSKSSSDVAEQMKKQ